MHAQHDLDTLTTTSDISTHSRLWMLLLLNYVSLMLLISLQQQEGMGLTGQVSAGDLERKPHPEQTKWNQTDYSTTSKNNNYSIGSEVNVRSVYHLHQELYLSTLDLVRHKADSRASYSQYFEIVGNKIEEYGITMQNIYNMDEKGWKLVRL